MHCLHAGSIEQQYHDVYNSDRRPGSLVPGTDYIKVDWSLLSLLIVRQALVGWIRTAERGQRRKYSPATRKEKEGDKQVECQSMAACKDTVVY